uniref:HTH OST-type domain-containing protein n=1 Tax=Chromera velia CCMP2878 TaxID=1169474 RepID=A0A0G4HH69_9ALVE|eukprot:Cvel_6775.t1-p1 / transcript=Cvel_6775.t1 / gene=Cvel_6775 / organism=Chromera_velia_CCMP2878 / gene_product=hypothetical protein / transcript_product=hypothetical protein / location=Cvel_scaffold340:26043-34503(+) / protein_length=2349 / sequence_SO=supercontig / SO=protein_coding / is_pseudo=false
MASVETESLPRSEDADTRVSSQQKSRGLSGHSCHTHHLQEALLEDGSSTDFAIQHTQSSDVSIAFQAVESLYRDQIVPVQFNLRGRLTELKASGDLIKEPLQYYKSAPELYVVATPEGISDVAVMFKNTPAWFKGWVDPSSEEDPYPEAMWKELGHFLQLGMQENEKAMCFTGGRYGMAQKLKGMRLPFLRECSLGSLCHVIQLALTQRKLLAYEDGKIKPAVTCATCANALLGVPDTHCATASCITDMAELKILVALTLQVFPRGYNLSTLKRKLKHKFQKDLCQTVFHYTKLLDLMTSDEMKEVCIIEVHNAKHIHVMPNPRAPSLALLKAACKGPIPEMIPERVSLSSPSHTESRVSSSDGHRKDRKGRRDCNSDKSQSLGEDNGTGSGGSRSSGDRCREGRITPDSDNPQGRLTLHRGASGDPLHVHGESSKLNAPLTDHLHGHGHRIRGRMPGGSPSPPTAGSAFTHTEGVHGLHGVWGGVGDATGTASASTSNGRSTTATSGNGRSSTGNSHSNSNGHWGSDTTGTTDRDGNGNGVHGHHGHVKASRNTSGGEGVSSMDSSELPSSAHSRPVETAFEGLRRPSPLGRDPLGMRHHRMRPNRYGSITQPRSAPPTSATGAEGDLQTSGVSDHDLDSAAQFGPGYARQVKMRFGKGKGERGRAGVAGSDPDGRENHSYPGMSLALGGLGMPSQDVSDLVGLEARDPDPLSRSPLFPFPQPIPHPNPELNTHVTRDQQREKRRRPPEGMISRGAHKETSSSGEICSWDFSFSASPSLSDEELEDGEGGSQSHQSQSGGGKGNGGTQKKRGSADAEEAKAERRRSRREDRRRSLGFWFQEDGRGRLEGETLRAPAEGLFPFPGGLLGQGGEGEFRDPLQLPRSHSQNHPPPQQHQPLVHDRIQPSLPSQPLVSSFDQVGDPPPLTFAETAMDGREGDNHSEGLVIGDLHHLEGGGSDGGGYVFPFSWDLLKVLDSGGREIESDLGVASDSDAAVGGRGKRNEIVVPGGELRRLGDQREDAVGLRASLSSHGEETTLRRDGRGGGSHEGGKPMDSPATCAHLSERASSTHHFPMGAMGGADGLKSLMGPVDGPPGSVSQSHLLALAHSAQESGESAGDPDEASAPIPLPSDLHLSGDLHHHPHSHEALLHGLAVFDKMCLETPPLHLQTAGESAGLTEMETWSPHYPGDLFGSSAQAAHQTAAVSPSPQLPDSSAVAPAEGAVLRSVTGGHLEGDVHTSSATPCATCNAQASHVPPPPGFSTHSPTVGPLNTGGGAQQQQQKQFSSVAESLKHNGVPPSAFPPSQTLSGVQPHSHPLPKTLLSTSIGTEIKEEREKSDSPRMALSVSLSFPLQSDEASAGGFHAVPFDANVVSAAAAAAASSKQHQEPQPLYLNQQLNETQNTGSPLPPLLPSPSVASGTPSSLQKTVRAPAKPGENGNIPQPPPPPPAPPSEIGSWNGAANGNGNGPGRERSPLLKQKPPPPPPPAPPVPPPPPSSKMPSPSPTQQPYQPPPPPPPPQPQPVALPPSMPLQQPQFSTEKAPLLATPPPSLVAAPAPPPPSQPPPPPPTMSTVSPSPNGGASNNGTPSISSAAGAPLQQSRGERSVSLTTIPVPPQQQQKQQMQTARSSLVSQLPTAPAGPAVAPFPLSSAVSTQGPLRTSASVCSSVPSVPVPLPPGNAQVHPVQQHRERVLVETSRAGDAAARFPAVMRSHPVAEHRACLSNGGTEIGTNGENVGVTGGTQYVNGYAETAGQQQQQQQQHAIASTTEGSQVPQSAVDGWSYASTSQTQYVNGVQLNGRCYENAGDVSRNVRSMSFGGNGRSSEASFPSPQQMASVAGTAPSPLAVPGRPNGQAQDAPKPLPPSMFASFSSPPVPTRVAAPMVVDSPPGSSPVPLVEATPCSHVAPATGVASCSQNGHSVIHHHQQQQQQHPQQQQQMVMSLQPYVAPPTRSDPPTTAAELYRQVATVPVRSVPYHQGPASASSHSATETSDLPPVSRYSLSLEQQQQRQQQPHKPCTCGCGPPTSPPASVSHVPQPVAVSRSSLMEDGRTAIGGAAPTMSPGQPGQVEMVRTAAVPSGAGMMWQDTNGHAAQPVGAVTLSPGGQVSLPPAGQGQGGVIRTVAAVPTAGAASAWHQQHQHLPAGHGGCLSAQQQQPLVQPHGQSQCLSFSSSSCHEWQQAEPPRAYASSSPRLEPCTHTATLTQSRHVVAAPLSPNIAPSTWSQQSPSRYSPGGLEHTTQQQQQCFVHSSDAGVALQAQQSSQAPVSGGHGHAVVPPTGYPSAAAAGSVLHRSVGGMPQPQPGFSSPPGRMEGEGNGNCMQVPSSAAAGADRYQVWYANGGGHGQGI